MRRRLTFSIVLSLAALACSEENGSGDGGTSGSDGSTTGMDGSTTGMDGSTPGTDGSTPGEDAQVVLPDGRVVGPMVEVECQGHLYQCGNLIDDDEDGLADSLDPDCLGPCDNNEGGFYLNIPGGDAQPCRLDCYFDQDEGRGNDMCQWDHRCDPLEPDVACDYQDPPPADATCPDVQTSQCETVCAPLVPNGCDCFGCCNLPAGTDRWVFIGSVNASGAPTCTLADVEDDSRCHPCTPVANCLNECGRCELCLGRTFEDLPADCFPTPPPDAGTLPDGGRIPPPDGGTTIDVCEDPERQDCGVPGLPPCPDGFYCITGCCTFFG
ncbi:MAG: hypothetical protein M5U28_30535 [Sandaracinaceae bacterium]|nr:hypothetical protein [Sandaracinaceae bacterium]